MNLPPSHLTEDARLAALRSYEILDTSPEKDFDDITSLVAVVCGAPMAMVSLMDESRQWFKSRLGIEMDQTPREHAFYAQALSTPDVLVVDDALKDPRFAGNPMVLAGPEIRFYAGAPLMAPGGAVLGALCVMDRVPRELTEPQMLALRVLSAQVMAQMQSRRDRRELQRAHQALQSADEERELTVQALRKSETEQRQLVQRLMEAQAVGNLGSWETDLSSHKVTWSAQTHHIFETTPGDFEPTHASFLERVHPEDRAAVDAAFVSSLGSEVPSSIEHRIVMEDGRVKHVEECWQSFFDDEGRLSRALGTCHDITARRRDEGQLRLLETCVSRMSDIVLITEAEKVDEPGPRILFVNESFVRRTGYDREEAIGRSPRFLQGPKTQRDALDRIQAALKSFTPVREEIVNYTKSGEAFWLEVDIAPVVDGTGTCTHFVAIERDITERKRTEERLQRLNRLYAVSSGINDAIVRLRELQELYREACRIAVEQGGLVMAWVGLVEESGEFIDPVAHWGRTEGYLDVVRVSTRPDLPFGQGPGGTAFRSRLPACCNDIAEAGDSFHTQAEALERGYRSCAAFPLKVEGAAIGIIVVYGDQAGYFGEEEIGLLNALAENLSFAVESHQRERQRQRTESALRASEASMAAAQRMGRFGSYELDLTKGGDFETCPLSWSEQMYAIAGYQPGEVPVTLALYLNHVHPDDVERVRQALGKTIQERGQASIMHRFLRPDGEELLLHQTVQLFTDERTGAAVKLIGTAHDITEIRRADEALHASEGRFRAFMTHSPAAGWIVDVEGRFSYLSPGYYTMFGAGSEDLTGRTIQEIYEPALANVYLEGNRDVLRQQSASEFVLPGRRWDGSPGEFLVVKFPITMPGREPLLGAIAIDVTAQRRAEMTLRENEARFRSYFELPLHGIAITSPEKGFVQANARICSILGYEHAELMAMSWAEMTFPADLEADMIQFNRLLAGEIDQYDLEKRFIRKDGQVIWASIGVGGIRDAEGGVAYLVGVLVDITERKQADDKLREQATLLEKAQDAIVVRDLNHRISYWNRSAERLYGWTAEETMGSSILDLLYRDPAPFHAATATTLAVGEWVGEIKQLNKDGRSLVVEARWTLVRDDEGRPKSILAIDTDVTSRKNLEQQFLRAQRMESIGTLAGGIAHDLNNVLAPIMMSIDLLRLKETDEGKKAVLTTIEGSARRGADMVRQVLSFARGVAGQQLEVNVGGLIKEVVKIANETFLKSIHVRSEVTEDLWTVEGDPTQLHQVLLNLCVNARDAMPAGGTLTLTATNVMFDEQYAGMNIEARPGPHVVIQVEDTGSGIAPEVLDRIFEPFFTTKETGKGTGLGLSTTLAIVKSHGGFVRVYSELGVGTKFRVHLPAHASPGVAAEISPQTELPRGSGELVLVVDDEAAVRQITRQTLEAFGYRVLLACDGVEATALYAAQMNEVAVVLTDMMMPIMDGPTTIQVLMRMNPQVRIIAASGLNANGMVAKAANAGVHHFLPKPYTAEAMLQALRLALRS